MSTLDRRTALLEGAAVSVLFNYVIAEINAKPGSEGALRDPPGSGG